MSEKPEIVAKEVSDEAGVYEVTVRYSGDSTLAQQDDSNSASSILRTTPKMFAFQTHKVG